MQIDMLRRFIYITVLDEETLRLFERLYQKHVEEHLVGISADTCFNWAITAEVERMHVLYIFALGCPALKKGCCIDS